MNTNGNRFLKFFKCLEKEYTDLSPWQVTWIISPWFYTNMCIYTYLPKGKLTDMWINKSFTALLDSSFDSASKDRLWVLIWPMTNRISALLKDCHGNREWCSSGGGTLDWWSFFYNQNPFFWNGDHQAGALVAIWFDVTGNTFPCFLHLRGLLGRDMSALLPSWNSLCKPKCKAMLFNTEG